MTINLTCSLDDIRKILGHLGQDYFHDFGATRAERYYAEANQITSIFRGGALTGQSDDEDDSDKTILEIEIEKALESVWPGVEICSFPLANISRTRGTQLT